MVIVAKNRHFLLNMALRNFVDDDEKQVLTILVAGQNRKVDEEEKMLDYVIDSLGQRRKSTFLTEDGLYEVLMQSRKPIAKHFKSRKYRL